MDSGLNDFLRQVPTGLFVMFCGSGILLFMIVTVMVGARRSRSRLAMASGGSMPASSPLSTGWNASMDHGDLPDLDSLVNNPSSGAESGARPVRSGTFTVYEAEGTAVDVVEVLTVLRDVAEGGLLIQIGDKVYRNPPALADAEFKRRFNTTVSELAKSLSNIRSAPSAPSPAPSSTGDTPAAIPPDVNASWTGTFPSVPGAMPGDLPKFKLSETPPPARPLRRVPKPTETIPEIDLGGSVEAYLQHKLSVTPQFAGRSIHIRPNVKGGISIEVDGKYYDSVNAVEDPAARAFLTSAVEEWQSRQ